MGTPERHETIRGWNWTPQSPGTAQVQQDGVQGRVVQNSPTGSWNGEVQIVQGDTTYTIEVDAEKHLDLKPWMSTRGARKLICAGVSLRVDGIIRDDNVVEATRIVLVGALPATPYLVRLLAFSIDTLALLFAKDKASTLVDLACALRPCSIGQVKHLFQLCETETKAGRFPLLFKHPELLDLCDKIRDAQGWSRCPSKAPTTSAETWSALLRMEQRWCEECKQEKTLAVPPTINTRVVFNGVDVDPSLNLPDPTDQRRLQYIDERKRPQVLWMLRLIRRLVENTDKHVISLVDVGGGRGDLANAVAAYFAQPDQRIKAHVFVLDVNQSSLEAGKQRAEAANIGTHMSFVSCDLANPEQVGEFIMKHEPIDVVFGLHCCGGLAEAAVELALRCSAQFSVSTCCFRSNEHLSSLSRLAAASMVDSDHKAEEHRSDRNLVTALAVTSGGQGQRRAVQSLNAMRLAAAEALFQEVHDHQGAIRTWQEFFPVEYSEQNCVMVGSPI
jgi:hypothetical protein